jgi:SAM-dependent methyltransferase
MREFDVESSDALRGLRREVPARCENADGYRLLIEPRDVNLVRVLHDDVASSSNPVEASTRPADTLKFELRAMYRDVVRKLGLTGREKVLEIGCGVGLFAPYILRRSVAYVGVDFAAKALEVARGRIPALDRGRCDFLELDASQPGALAGLYGGFDRVLMYAVLHYARNEDEGVRLLEAAVRCVRPGGFVLVGNVPLEELTLDVARSWLSRPGRIGRVTACARWILDGSTAVGRTPWWKLRVAYVFYLKAILRRIRSPRTFATATLPPGYSVHLTMPLVEKWVGLSARGAALRWHAPSPAAPLALTRADLTIRPSPPP